MCLARLPITCWFSIAVVLISSSCCSNGNPSDDIVHTGVGIEEVSDSIEIRNADSVERLEGLRLCIEKKDVFGLEEKIVDVGSDELNRFRVDGQSLLHVAIVKRNGKAISVLVDNGMHLDIVNDDGDTVLLYAMKGSRVREALTLLEQGADPKRKDRIGLTALHYACMVSTWNQHNGYHRLALELIVCGAEIDAVDNRGNTPLHGAAYFGYYNQCKFLVENGASFSIQNANGDTPLDMVSRKGDLFLAEGFADRSYIGLSDTKEYLEAIMAEKKD